MRLSEHFTLAEMTASQTAARTGIDNTPSDEEIGALVLLCCEILEPLRAALGRPIIVTSGYRCLPLNRAIGSSDRSQHVQGQAADIKVHQLSPLSVCGHIHRLGLPFDQLIHEFGAWTHVSMARKGKKPRGQLLTIDRHGARNGLIEVRP